MKALRAGRMITSHGGFGMLVALTRMRSDHQVFWSSGGNSYVVSDALKIVSVNGLGEIRWTVEEWNRDEESLAAINYFLEEVRS